MAAAGGKRDVEETEWTEAPWSPWEGLRGSSADHLWFYTYPTVLSAGWARFRRGWKSQGETQV